MTTRCHWHFPCLFVPVLGLLLVAACSGPDGNVPASTPTSTPPTATTAAASPTLAPTLVPTLAPTLTPTRAPSPSATATSTLAPTATVSPTSIPPTATATATVTATVVPLPQGGAELRILGKVVQRVIAGDAEGKVLYAVTSAGLSRSGDGGRTWSAAGDVQAGETLVALNNPDVLYAGAHQPCAKGGPSTPFTRSIDGGKSWQQFDAGAGVQPLLVVSGQHTTVVGSSCALVLSADGGQSFTPVAVTTNYDTTGAASNDPALAQIVVLGTSEGGTTLLRKLDLVSINAPADAGVLATFFGAGAVVWDGDRIVLATPEGVGVSLDNGATWTWSRSGLEHVTFSVDPLTEAIPPTEQGQSFGFSVIRIDLADPQRVWAGGELGAWRSANGGQSWTQLGNKSRIDSLIVSTAAGRVFVSSDGGTRMWTLDGQ